MHLHRIVSETITKIVESLRANRPEEVWHCLDGMMREANSQAQFFWRATFTANVGWSIPSRAAIRAVADILGDGTMLSIGTGLGFWESLLSGSHANIIATDIRVPASPFFTGTYQTMDACTAVLTYRDASVLFINWPREFATDAVSLWRGKYVVSIGENDMDGCTGRVGGELEDSTDWRKIKTIDIPCWFGIRDDLRIYERVIF